MAIDGSGSSDISPYSSAVRVLRLNAGHDLDGGAGSPRFYDRCLRGAYVVAAVTDCSDGACSQFVCNSGRSSSSSRSVVRQKGVTGLAN
mmetsp:Transcript_22761/g.42342  ORF Transcript_22761/g.42342 Transcript_22761/m.42342 type:complete len:89 (+) Transcript_22761:1628-1894(+)